MDEKVLQRIDKYLAKDAWQVLLVDVETPQDVVELILRYQVGNNRFLKASDYAKKDEYPRLDELLNDIAKDGTYFVTELSSFLKLKGKDELILKLKALLGMSIKGHAVVITYQCRSHLRDLLAFDRRLKQKIVLGDTTDSYLDPTLIFVAQGLPLPPNVPSVRGIHRLAELVEKQKENTYYIITAKTSSSYPHSLYKIICRKDAYDCLLFKDSLTQSLPKEWGTPAQWSYALEKFKDGQSWAEVITAEFGNKDSLELLFTTVKDMDAERQWLYFLGLKLYGAKSNSYLHKASKKAQSFKDVVHQLFTLILEVEPSSESFLAYYKTRKALLKQFGSATEEVSSYCTLCRGKGKQALWYLTDMTQLEKEAILANIAKYAAEYQQKTQELKLLLRLVYPDLAAYLAPYDFKQELLNKYFSAYKYQKLFNQISPDFEKVVLEQAQKREFFGVLKARSALLDNYTQDNPHIYFVDALGVEYLGYIFALSSEMRLKASAVVARCDLPTLTTVNKYFLDDLVSRGFTVTTVKELDELKHHGKGDYDYQKSKLPLHIVRELEILRDLLDKIKGKLIRGEISKAVIVSDHGASRLAVIHETENIWQMQEKGRHSGRCCLRSEVDEQPECALEEGDYWVLANYDRFKGSKKANVEVHGGATLEEVTVPIIELTYSGDIVTAYLGDADSDTYAPGILEIKVSYKKKAALKIYPTATLTEVKIAINDKFYEATAVDANCWRVEMPDLKKAGLYTVDVYEGANKIVTGLKLKVSKEGIKNKSIL